MLNLISGKSRYLFTRKSNDKNEENDRPNVHRIAILRQELIQKPQFLQNLRQRAFSFLHNVRILSQNRLLNNIPKPPSQFHHQFSPRHCEALDLILQTLLLRHRRLLLRIRRQQNGGGISGEYYAGIFN